MEDKAIVALFWARDEAAIAAAGAQYGSRLRALAQDITGDPETARECENDTLLAAWNAIPPHRPETYLYAFLARITRNLALNRCRDSQRLKRRAHIQTLSAELEQCIPAPDDALCRLEELALQEVIHAFLTGLRPQARVVFLRRYWYLDSVADIARRYGLSQSKVKTMLHRSRKGLRAFLEKEGICL